MACAACWQLSAGSARHSESDTSRYKAAMPNFNLRHLIASETHNKQIVVQYRVVKFSFPPSYSSRLARFTRLQRIQ